MSHEHDHGGMQMPPGPMAGDDMNMPGMHMSFFWGKDVIILFAGWPDNRLPMYILALFFVFVLSVGVEILSISPTLKPGMNPMVSGFVQSSVYAFRMGFAYLVMLSVMSYNLGIFLAVVAGHALGFFLIKCRAPAMTGRADGSSPILSPKV